MALAEGERKGKVMRYLTTRLGVAAFGREKARPHSGGRGGGGKSGEGYRGR